MKPWKPWKPLKPLAAMVALHPILSPGDVSGRHEGERVGNSIGGEASTNPAGDGGQAQDVHSDRPLAIADGLEDWRDVVLT